MTTTRSAALFDGREVDWAAARTAAALRAIRRDGARPVYGSSWPGSATAYGLWHVPGLAEAAVGRALVQLRPALVLGRGRPRLTSDDLAVRRAALLALALVAPVLGEPVVAMAESVLGCLAGHPPVDAVHFALHGKLDVTGTQDGLLMAAALPAPKVIPGTASISTPADERPMADNGAETVLAYGYFSHPLLRVTWSGRSNSA